MRDPSYELDPGIRWSRLSKLVDESPLAFSRQKPVEPTDAMRTGTLLHMMALDPDALMSVVVQPSFGDLRTKAAKAARDAWEAENTHVHPDFRFTQREWDTALAAAEAVAARGIVSDLMFREQPIYWEYEGVRCKGIPDAFLDGGYVLDLKNTRLRRLHQMRNEAAQRLYMCQLAWYHYGLTANGVSLPELPRIVFVQDAAPFDVVQMQMTPHTFEVATNMWQQAIRTYKECQASGRWPGIMGNDECIPWELPSFAVPHDDDFEDVEGWEQC